MSDIAQNNKRAARNTMYMYIRMLLLLFIGLYTSRLILATLGISDYGLYNVVGGVVSMVAFLNAALSSGTQRFLNFELGKNDIGRVRNVFANAMTQHLMLVVVVLVLAETLGLWYVCNKLNIEIGREFAAKWIYQTTILSLCVQIIQIPFISVIIAHERMSIYAYIGILESLLRLGVVFLLRLGNADRLVLYGTLMFVSQLIISLVYIFYSLYSFEEVRIKFGYDKKMFKEIFSFTGWNIFGSFCSICNSQGTNIVINLFFGTVVNAARGVAFQVNGMITSFVSNFQIAVKPQIVKYYANGENEEMVNLVINTAKISAYLMIFLSVPLMAEIKTVLHLWLGVFPDYTPWFVTLILIRSVFYSMVSATLMMVHATGYVRKVSIYSGISYLLVLPLSYFLFSMGMSPYSVFVVNIFACIADQFFELYWLHHYIGLSVSRFLKDVYGHVLPLLGMNLIVAYVLHRYFCGIDLNEVLSSVCVIILTGIAAFVSIFFFGLNQEMRNVLIKKTASVLHLSK